MVISCFRAEKEPVLTKANTGFKRVVVMVVIRPAGAL